MFNGSKLKEVRTRKGLTLKDLADKSGVPFTTINGWEINQHAKPRKSLLLKVCEALDINIASLYVEEKDDPTDSVEILKLIEKIINAYNKQPDDPRLAEAEKLFEK